MGDGELGSRAWQMCEDRKSCTELTHRFIPNKGYEHLALIPLDEAGVYELDTSQDDALLASVMRKILSGKHGWVDYSPRGGRWPGPAWVTVDVRGVDLTDEEFAAVERAGE